MPRKTTAPARSKPLRRATKAETKAILRDPAAMQAIAKAKAGAGRYYRLSECN